MFLNSELTDKPIMIKIRITDIALPPVIYIYSERTLFYLLLSDRTCMQKGSPAGTDFSI